MTFKQTSTGALLTTDNEDVIEMMKSSDAYEVVKPTKGKTAKSGDKEKPTE